MKITYDPEGDILYLRLRKGVVAHSEPLPDQEDIVIDYDQADLPIGIEMMNISDLVDSTRLSIEIALPASLKLGQGGCKGTPSRRNADL